MSRTQKSSQSDLDETEQALLQQLGLRSPELPNLRRYWAAVHAGLTKRWNSGAVEGHVNRLKVIKRQMCGRYVIWEYTG